MRRVWEQRERREVGSVVSAVRMGRVSGGWLGFEAHLRVWANLVGFRPAMAMELRDDDDWLLKNLRVSLRTYLPVKPDAPRIIRSNFFVTFGSIFLRREEENGFLV
ncbi:putative mitochondrial saccharopine dehydrogenase oxidoreductase [Trifolium repens]|nr:putative mitochondrial saccharopine dehydrogenase oxidoreductase [Trifolium repens]